MSENSEKDASSSRLVAAASVGIARRRLIRAGLAAAPVMLALKSQSALATGVDHLHCSVWASLSAAKGCMKSHAPVPGKTCNHYDDWSNNTTYTYCSHKYHDDPGTTTNKVPYQDTCFRDKVTNTYYRYHSLQQVCAGKDSYGNAFSISDSKKQKLGRHCAAMYLNCKSGNSPVTEQQIKDLWTACKDGSGTWTPNTGGTAWDRDQCIAYFDYICKGTIPSTWSLACQA